MHPRLGRFRAKSKRKYSVPSKSDCLKLLRRQHWNRGEGTSAHESHATVRTRVVSENDAAKQIDTAVHTVHAVQTILPKHGDRRRTRKRKTPPRALKGLTALLAARTLPMLRANL